MFEQPPGTADKNRPSKNRSRLGLLIETHSKSKAVHIIADILETIPRSPLFVELMSHSSSCPLLSLLAALSASDRS